MTEDGGRQNCGRIAMGGMKKGTPLSMDVLQAGGAVIDFFLGRQNSQSSVA